MDSSQILMVLLISVNIILLAYNFHISRQLSSDRRRHREEIGVLNSDISALCSGATGLGNHLTDIEHQLRRLYERQDQIELRDPAERDYHNAVRLIQDGADIDKLVATCGLTRGEAELLVRLHGERYEDGRDLPPLRRASGA